MKLPDSLKKLAIVLPPGLLAALELFHAHGHHDAVYETLKSQVDRWMVVHYLQLLLFPLTAWSVYQLTAGEKTWKAWLCAIGMSIFGLGYAAYDSIAGIGTGILVSEGNRMGQIEGVPRSFELICNEIIQSYYHSPMSGNIARVAVAGAIVGFATTAWVLYEKGFGVFPIMMLAGACWGVTKTHAPPYGPITYGFVFAAVVSVVYFAPKTMTVRST